MTNLTDWHNRGPNPRGTVIVLLVGCSLGVLISLETIITAACVKGPHDFGMYNNLKTICHVWKGTDGYRRQATVHINSSKNIHKSHHWDYDGECEE